MTMRLIIIFLLILTSIVTSKRTYISKRHAIKTIHVKDGDIVDCVDIYKQPAFDHPLLSSHTIQMKSTHLHAVKDWTLQNNKSSKVLPSQVWLHYGSCPNRTIPIRRPSNNHQTNVHPSKVIITPNHSFAVARIEGSNYTGARANIKVWNPYLISVDDYSSSKVMLRTGPLESFETMEAGWAVNPFLYEDAKTRLFAYWSVDGMRLTGCFDLMCPGFVQTSREILLGGEIGSYNYGSEMMFQISKDPDTNNWWLKYDDEEVGYWPGDIFQLMTHHATLVQWGGEVCSPKVGRCPHTDTAMGNGQFSNPKFKSSGSMTGMLVEESSYPLKRPQTLFLSSDEWNCYDVYLLKEHVPEPILLYGGPGALSNPRC